MNVAAMNIFNPMNFGAIADGLTPATAAIQKAIDACAAAGGGMVYVPPGRYLIGPVYLKSHVNLHIEAGAILLGSPNKRDYKIVTRRLAGKVQPTIEALINGDDLQHVSITGRGTIDGQGETFWGPIMAFLRTPKDQRPDWSHMAPESEEYIYGTPFARARLVEIQRCRNVLIEGVTLQNSGFWNLNPMFCENVVIHGVTLYNPEGLAPNGDGMDINSCRNVRISDCFVDVNDDCICLKSGWNEGGFPTENVTITNCITRGGHGGVTIGSDMSGGVRNVTVSNCVFHGTDIGIRFKTMRGRGGVVENILFSNIVMDGVREAISMDMHYWRPMPAGPATEQTPRFRNIRLHQVDAANSKEAGFWHGLEEMPIEEVTLDSVRIQSQTPLRIRHARALNFRHLRLECPTAPELILEDVSDVSIERFHAAANRAAGPAIRLVRTEHVSVEGCFAPGAGENPVQNG